MTATVNPLPDETPDPRAASPAACAEAAAILLTRTGLTEAQIADLLSFAQRRGLVTAAAVAAEERARLRLAGGTP
jgi:indole-3-glycerol phosphate synthase